MIGWCRGVEVFWQAFSTFGRPGESSILLEYVPIKLDSSLAVFALEEDPWQALISVFDDAVKDGQGLPKDCDLFGEALLFHHAP